MKHQDVEEATTTTTKEKVVKNCYQEIMMFLH